MTLSRVMALCLAVMIVLSSPVLVQAATAGLTHLNAVPSAAPMLPDGQPLSPEELLEADGEFWWWLFDLGRRMVIGAIAGASAYFLGDADVWAAARLGLVAAIASCF